MSFGIFKEVIILKNDIRLCVSNMSNMDNMYILTLEEYVT